MMEIVEGGRRRVPDEDVPLPGGDSAARRSRAIPKRCVCHPKDRWEAQVRVRPLLDDLSGPVLVMMPDGPAADHSIHSYSAGSTVFVRFQYSSSVKGQF